MYAKLVAFALCAATLASATVAPPTGGPVSNTWNKKENKCNVGKLQCCGSFQKATSKQGADQSGIIGAALGQVSALIGVNCNPITGVIVGVSGINCNGSPACCKKVNSGGVVGLACDPINANL